MYVGLQILLRLAWGKASADLCGWPAAIAALVFAASVAVLIEAVRKAR
jgi:hypothetical protein